MDLIRIESPADPRVAAYRDIRERDLVGRDGMFIAEGKFILETLFTRSRFAPVSAFILEDRLDGLGEVLGRAPDGFPVHVTSRSVMDAIAGFPVHRGVLALGRADATSGLPSIARGIGVLVNIANPDNVGAIFRNAAGLGLDGLVLDQRTCSPLYRKAIRVSMGASLVLPFEIAPDIEDWIERKRQSGFRAYALTPSAPHALEEVHLGERSLFLFGEEAHGLDAGIMDLCEQISIPMAHGTDSLNVAASSAIVFDAWRRTRARRP